MLQNSNETDCGGSEERELKRRGETRLLEINTSHERVGAPDTRGTNGSMAHPLWAKPLPADPSRLAPSLVKQVGSGFETSRAFGSPRALTTCHTVSCPQPDFEATKEAAEAQSERILLDRPRCHWIPNVPPVCRHATAGS